MYLEQRVEELEKQVKELLEVVKGKNKTDYEMTIFEGVYYYKSSDEAIDGDLVALRTDTKSDLIKKDKFYKVYYSESNNRLEVNGCSLYSDKYNRTKDTLEVFKPIKFSSDSIQAKPSNQQRKELIQESKDFVKELTKYIKDIYNQNHPIYGEIKREVYVYLYKKVDFSVDYNNRKVTVTIATNLGTTFTATAKCLPNDVFNVHLGKAIALGKVLGLDVSKFTHAVQPNEVVVGHIIASTAHEDVLWLVGSLSGNNNLTVKSHYDKCSVSKKVTYELTEKDDVVYITDDTNAKY